MAAVAEIIQNSFGPRNGNKNSTMGTSNHVQSHSRVRAYTGAKCHRQFAECCHRLYVLLRTRESAVGPAVGGRTAVPHPLQPDFPWLIGKFVLGSIGGAYAR